VCLCVVGTQTPFYHPLKNCEFQVSSAADQMAIINNSAYMEKIEWTVQQWNERIKQMQEMGLTDEQISYVLECVVVVSDKPIFFLSDD